MNKKPLILMAILICLASVTVNAWAQTLAYSNGIENYNENITMGANNFWGWTFNGTDAYLYAVTFKFENTTASVSGGSVEARLYNATTTKPEPSAPVEATSTNSYNLLNLGAAVIMNFTFDSTYYLDSGQKYTIVFCCPATMTQNIRLYGDTTGTCAYTSNGGTTWQNSATTHEPIFYLYTTDTEGAGEEEETDPGSWEYPGTSQDVINAVAGFIVPATLTLAPAFLLVFLTGKADKWIILIGLAIGASLGYIIMPSLVPLWIVFVVIIGLVGMAYQSVRGGG